MNFQSLDQPYKRFMPKYELDPEITDTLESEADAKKYVKKAIAHQKKLEEQFAKEEAARQEKEAAAAKEAAAKKQAKEPKQQPE